MSNKNLENRNLHWQHRIGLLDNFFEVNSPIFYLSSEDPISVSGYFSRILYIPTYSIEKCDCKMANANPPVQQKTKCSTCKDVTCIPEMLPCSHTLCLESIEKSKSGNDESSSTMPCPTCQVNFDIPSIWMLKQHRVIVEKITGPEFSSEMDASKQTECEVCLVIRKSKVTASSFCMVCGQAMCEQCSASHRGMKMSMTHTQIPIGEGTTSTTAQMKKKESKRYSCGKHPKKEINIVCRQCLMIICLDCSFADHSNHDVYDIADVAEECKKKVMHSCDEVNKLVIKMREKYESVGARHESFINGLCTSISAVFARTSRTIDKHAQILMDKLTYNRVIFGKATPRLRERLFETIEKHREFIEHCNSVVKDEDALNVCRIAGDLLETAEGIQIQSFHKSCDLPEIVFLPSSDRDMTAPQNNTVGRIHGEINSRSSFAHH